MLNKPCPPLEQLENGSKNDTDREYLLGETVLFTCDNGYHNTGVETTICTNYGIWSHQQLGVKPPICEENVCVAPENPRHGSIGYPRNTSILKTGTEITYSCAVGYKLNGPRTRQCGMDGDWTDSEPTCVENSCNVLENPDHGVILYPANKSHFDVGANITYRCDTGYKLQGTEMRRCETGGEWGGKAPSCVSVECIEPVTPRNGYKVTPSGSVYFVSDSIVQFKCNSGYLVKGHITLRYLPNGTWDGDVPTCTAERQWSELAIAMCISSVVLIGFVIGVCFLHKMKPQNRFNRREKKYESIKNKLEDQTEERTIDPVDYATINTKKDVSMQYKAVPKGLPPRHKPDETENATVHVSMDDRKTSPIFTGNVASCNFIYGHMNSLNQDENKTMTFNNPLKENNDERPSRYDRTAPFSETAEPKDYEHNKEEGKSTPDNNEHDNNTIIAQETSKI